MFTNGGILGVAGSGGGGGGGVPQTGLIAEFRDAGTYFNDTTHDWEAANDSSLKFVDAGASYDDPSLNGSTNRVDFGGTARLGLNAALLSAIDGADDLVVVVGGKAVSPSGLLFYIGDSGLDYRHNTLFYSNVAQVISERGTTYIAQASGALSNDTLYVVTTESLRDGLTSVQIDDGTPATAGTNDDNAMSTTGATITTAYINNGNGSGSSSCGFIAIYDGLTSEDLTTLLGLVEDNADYGMAGWTL